MRRNYNDLTSKNTHKELSYFSLSQFSILCLLRRGIHPWVWARTGGFNQPTYRGMRINGVRGATWSSQHGWSGDGRPEAE